MTGELAVPEPEPPVNPDWRDLTRQAALLVPNVVKLLGRVVKDQRVPLRYKLEAGVVLAYVVSPVDLMPDFVPVVGKIDDVLLVAMTVRHLLDGAGEDIIREHWDGTDEAYELIRTASELASSIAPRSLASWPGLPRQLRRLFQ